ncbi:MAG: hypothetical protein EZS28_003222 [Streblomastix strix]|uniref:Uncharacterized protein n=1 Tax=Streblomastix strix TaxID=222440 RepID=A0A5J4X235_9EUKA|nr:MAG: hypothetical protein EZS28_003222 [Streblomastix strix]
MNRFLAKAIQVQASKPIEAQLESIAVIPFKNDSEHHYSIKEIKPESQMPVLFDKDIIICLSDSDHEVTQIQNSFLSIVLTANLQFENKFDQFDDSYKDGVILFVGLKSGSNIIREYTIFHCERTIDGSLLNEATTESFIYNTFKPMSEKNNKKLTHSLYEYIHKFDTSAYGTYITMRQIEEAIGTQTKVLYLMRVRFRISVPLDDLQTNVNLCVIRQLESQRDQCHHLHLQLHPSKLIPALLLSLKKGDQSITEKFTADSTLYRIISSALKQSPQEMRFYLPNVHPGWKAFVKSVIVGCGEHINRCGRSDPYSIPTASMKISDKKKRSCLPPIQFPFQSSHLSLPPNINLGFGLTFLFLLIVVHILDYHLERSTEEEDDILVILCSCKCQSFQTIGYTICMVDVCSDRLPDIQQYWREIIVYMPDDEEDEYKKK